MIMHTATWTNSNGATLCIRTAGTNIVSARPAPRAYRVTAEESVLSRGAVGWNRIECPFIGRPDVCAAVDAHGVTVLADGSVDLLALFANASASRAEYVRVAAGGSAVCAG